jgi:hypothetical protein
MQGEQFFHCLEFNEYAVFNNEVDSISGFELYAVVDDGKPNLMPETDPVDGQLMTEACVVSALQAASSESAMDLESGADNPFRNRSVQAQSSSSVSSASSAVASLCVVAAIVAVQEALL